MERLVADMAIVTGDSPLKKFSEGLHLKAPAGNFEPFARLFPVSFAIPRPNSFYYGANHRHTAPPNHTRQTVAS